MTFPWPLLFLYDNDNFFIISVYDQILNICVNISRFFLYKLFLFLTIAIYFLISKIYFRSIYFGKPHAISLSNRDIYLHYVFETKIYFDKYVLICYCCSKYKLSSTMIISILLLLYTNKWMASVAPSNWIFDLFPCCLRGIKISLFV